MSNFTANQQKSIDHRKGNLLISAGAGSGKTSVLTQHVIGLINDPVNPVDIDRLLIVTFTKAAAAEMKGRIASQISDRRQLALLSHSHISTIDSFCSWVVKNNFECIDLDPDYQMAKDAELKLLKHDAFDEMMEERYLTREPEFISFINSYTNGKTDDSVFNLLEIFYNKAMSQPDPEKYFEDLMKKSLTGHDDIYEFNEIKEYIKQAKEEICFASENIESMADITEGTRFDEKGIFERDCDIVMRIRNSETPKEFIEAIRETWPAKPRETEKSPFNDNERLYNAYRSTVKDAIKPVKDLFKDAENKADIINKTLGYVKTFFNLLLEYYNRVQGEKKERKIADFADVEHYALKILRDNPGVREKISGMFDEVLIDEYQDSNELQEELFSLVSNGSNLFMVGDIKQSIYGFRNASPELFKSRYSLYETTDAGEKIDLTENFRCRKEVIDSVNEVFNRIMTADMGGSDYKGKAELVFSANYAPAEGNEYKSEFIYVESNEGSNIRANYMAQVVADRINQLVYGEKPLLVFDAKLGERRPVQFRDICILMRGVSSNIEVYQKALSDAGIPAVSTKTEGYFDSPEVKLILDALKIIDNPRQDIPLAAVMLSPLCGFTNDEIAGIKISYVDPLKNNVGQHNDFYDAVMASDSPKCQEFIKNLDRYRKAALSYSILELINMILKDTGYDYYLAALKNGANRLANIDMLKQMAREYETTSYSGIFDFNRYISRIIKYDIDSDQANTLSEGENFVKISTIHGSKGLEFPVVIVTQLSSQFIFDDKDAISVNPGYGIAMNYNDADKSIKIESIAKKCINKINRSENLSEEMRLLYVAMTRAREKLIMVSSQVREPEALINKVKDFEIIPSSLLSGIKSYHELFYAAIAGENICSEYWDIYKGDFSPRVTVKKMVYQKKTDRQQFEADAAHFEGSDNFSANLLQSYKHEASLSVKGSYSVSEIKKLSMQSEIYGDEQENREHLYHANPKGAAIGTAYHLVFEKLDPLKAGDMDYVNTLLDELTEKGLIAKDIAGKISPEKISAFYLTDIGGKVKKAYQTNALKREQPFILGIPASDVKSECDDDEPVIIQGVIDMFFTEPDGITLIDYKSDYIEDGEEQVLADRYKIQLDYYTKALTSAYNIPVKKRYLYSIRLKKFIEVE